MVLANKSVHLRQLQNHIVADNAGFDTVNHVSMKLGDILCNGAQRESKTCGINIRSRSTLLSCRVLDLGATVFLHECIFITVLRFALIWQKQGIEGGTCWPLGNYQRPGEQEGNITTCAAVRQTDVLGHYATSAPYSTAHIMTYITLQV